MCVGVCGEIIELMDDQFAYIDVLGVKAKVNVILIENPKIHDYVLIHTGYAIQKVSKDYADSLSHILNEWLDLDE